MKLSAVVLAVVLSAATANASSIHQGPGLISRHSSMARRQAGGDNTGSKPAERTTRRRCKARPSDAPANLAPSPAATSPAAQAPANTPAPAPANNNPAPPANNNNSGGAKMVYSDYCGGARSTAEITRESGPNGHIDFLNCGIHSGGWAPPRLTFDQLSIVPLHDALQNPNSPFHACSAFFWAFEQFGNANGIPPIVLASFAMQESSCNPDTVGGGGEQGLMQITQEKCGGAPGGNCRDPGFNIRTGAEYFARTLNANGGDVLKSIGQYNGWQPGLTFERATNARFSNCCRCQNNVDYLHQFLNGWCQNRNAYDAGLRLGKYFNLDVCN
ncbi:glycoside hydrolase family 23 protein [Coprinopsis sp. MPI-PUGE-AT-0042]|nr:glycoside hydrolase family 23 protein [Coprinopsis sp. MPI-PUGE-AT-0042]